MVIPIGKAPPPSGDLTDLLLDCHQRIRHFAALARAAGERPGAGDREVRDACERVERYFTEALPLHTLDEDVSLLPRLQGRSADLDDALELMHAQHVEHQASLDALFAASAALRAAPGDPDRRAALASIAARLEQALEEHLQMEEGRVFPAIRTLLPEDVQVEIRDELRDRRR